MLLRKASTDLRGEKNKNGTNHFKMKLKYRLFFLFALTIIGITDHISLAQNRNIDSLVAIIKTAKPDTNQANYLNKLSGEYINIGDLTNGLNCANKSLALANSITIGNKKGWSKGIAIAYNNIGIIYWHQGNYPDALKSHFNSLKIREEIGNKKGIADSYSNIGLVYEAMGNYPDALRNDFTSLKIREEIGDKNGITKSYNNIAIIYYNQANFIEALKNFLASLKISQELKNKYGMASSYNGIGAIYKEQGNYEEALKNYFSSLKIKEEIGDKLGIAHTSSNIGLVYRVQGNYSEALKNYFVALKICQDIGDRTTLPGLFCNIATIQLKLLKLNEAKEYLSKALVISKEIGAKDDIRNCYKGLATVDSAQGNWRSAFQYHKLFMIYKDSIDNEETKKKTIETAMTYEFEKQELETKAIQDKKDAMTLAEKKKQKIIIWSVTLGLLLVLVFTGFVIRSLRLTQKQKQIILQKSILVEEKNKLIVEKSKLVEEKNKDIIDSINYAKRIQNALLKEQEHVNEQLPSHFVLFKPKDIVSGDFYWSLEKNGYWYLAVADCTGHGVPGAFMSMLGIAFLNEITAPDQLLCPAEILDQLSNKVVKELGQGGKMGQSKDGMDISLIRLNLKTKELQWAGANNPIYFIPNNELIEIKPNKRPIGYHITTQPFTNHEIKLEPGTAFYLFTDGYADQFGGINEKKFMYKSFKELLLSLNDKSMQTRKEILLQTFTNWKGNLEQVDDVCVVGVVV